MYKVWGSNQREHCCRTTECNNAWQTEIHFQNNIHDNHNNSSCEQKDPHLLLHHKHNHNRSRPVSCFYATAQTHTLAAKSAKNTINFSQKEEEARLEQHAMPNHTHTCVCKNRINMIYMQAHCIVGGRLGGGNANENKSVTHFLATEKWEAQLSNTRRWMAMQKMRKRERELKRGCGSRRQHAMSLMHKYIEHTDILWGTVLCQNVWKSIKKC